MSAEKIHFFCATWFWKLWNLSSLNIWLQPNKSTSQRRNADLRVRVWIRTPAGEWRGVEEEKGGRQDFRTQRSALGPAALRNNNMGKKTSREETLNDRARGHSRYESLRSRFSEIKNRQEGSFQKSTALRCLFYILLPTARNLKETRLLWEHVINSLMR